MAVLGGLVLLALKAYQQPPQAAPQRSAPAEARTTSQGQQPAAQATGAFDYYVLSLSWSPEYCATEARPNDMQCQRAYAFVLHGLWPQNEQGYPENCGKGEYLDNDLIQRMLPIMPSKPLVIHEWNKHGVCSGLGPAQYFATAERAYQAISIPARYRTLSEPMTRTVPVLERDFLAANPSLKSDGIAVQCSGHYLSEVRVCLGKDLQPRACGPDVRDHCKGDFVLRPVR